MTKIRNSFKLCSYKPLNKGFTLTELLVVVLIIGILAAIALPSYTKSVKKSRVSDALNNLNIVSLKQEDYLLNNEKYADTFKDLNVPIAGMTSVEGNTARVGNFEYTLNQACISAVSSGEDKYTLVRNVDTRETGCINGGQSDVCAMFADLVATDSVGCEYVAPGGDDAPSEITPTPKDCGSCTQTCWDGSTITGSCNTNTGLCDYTGVSCPQEGECQNGETKTQNNCVYTCSGNSWQYSAPAPGYTGYDPSTNSCYKNACPEGTVQKNTINDVHYCRTYTMGKWVPEGWTQPC